MQYMLTIYDDQSSWATATPEEIGAMMKAYEQFSTDVKGAGAFVAGEASRRSPPPPPCA